MTHDVYDWWKKNIAREAGIKKPNPAMFDAVCCSLGYDVLKQDMRKDKEKVRV
jgi:hypothetical protein